MTLAGTAAIGKPEGPLRADYAQSLQYAGRGRAASLVMERSAATNSHST